MILYTTVGIKKENPAIHPKISEYPVFADIDILSIHEILLNLLIVAKVKSEPCWTIRSLDMLSKTDKQISYPRRLTVHIRVNDSSSADLLCLTDQLLCCS